MHYLRTNKDNRNAPYLQIMVPATQETQLDNTRYANQLGVSVDGEQRSGQLRI